LKPANNNHIIQQELRKDGKVESARCQYCFARKHEEKPHLPFQAAALALLVFSCGQGQKAVKPPAKGTVRGVVTESGKKPARGGAVVESGRRLGHDHARGIIQPFRVTYGNYFVNVTKEGYEPYRCSDRRSGFRRMAVVEHDRENQVKDDKAPQVSEFGVTKRDTASWKSP